MSHLGEKHFTDRQDYRQAQADLIQKGLYGGLPAEDIIQKAKGEGARGGKVIGHTKSGKPIYESASHPSHRNDFSKEDHDDAIALHNKKMKEDKGNETTHYNAVDKHEALKKMKKDSKESGVEEDQVKDAAAKHDHSEKEFEDVDEDHKHKKGDAVKVHHGITDPKGKQGETGTVTHSDDDEVHVRFSDGNLGIYQHNTLKKEKKDIKKSDDSDISKAFEILGIDIKKGGEGSRGGKIIGHTKSGKPIYDSASHSAHKNFTADEHREAAGKHIDKKDSSTEESVRDSHEFQAKEHEAAAKEKSSKRAAGKDTMKNSPANSKEDEAWNKFKDNTRKHFEGGDKKESKMDLSKHTDKELDEAYLIRAKQGMPDKHSEMKQIEAEKEKRGLKKAEGDVNDGSFDKAMTAEVGEGVTQKESVEHNPKDMQNPKSSDLKKAYEILGLGDLIEKAEGARGGKIIGHTKSGNPIYETKKIGTDSYHKINHKISGDKWISDSHEMDEEQHRQKASFHSEQAHRNQDQPDRLEYHDEQNEDHIKHKRNLEKLNKEKNNSQSQFEDAIYEAGADKKRKDDLLAEVMKKTK